VYPIVTRVVTTRFIAWAIAVGLNCIRFAGFNVSGSRSVHAARTTPKRATATNTTRHDPNSRITVPMLGARTGTMMNTAMMKDIARAMRSPSNRSRTTETLTTRGPAAPMPQTNRLAITRPSVGATAAARAPKT
jgi:hypothetical protein